MGVMGLLFALFTGGYILGVWMACIVFWQRERAYEDFAPGALASTLDAVPGDASRPVEKSQ